MKCQATRSRTQNRTIARKLLADKLDEREKGPNSRKALKADIERKKKASKAKKANRKYKAMAEGEREEMEADANEEVTEEIAGEAMSESSATSTEDNPKENDIGKDELPEWERKWRELRGIK